MTESLKELNMTLCLWVSSCSIRVIWDVRVVILVIMIAITPYRVSTMITMATEMKNWESSLNSLLMKEKPETMRNCERVRKKATKKYLLVLISSTKSRLI